MTMFRSLRLAAPLILLTATVAIAQQTQQQMPPMPKPGPEHALLKMDVGTWDAVVEFALAPGAPPQTSKGVETNKLGCGGLCLISDFKGQAMGLPFEGHGVTTWDARQKKYVGSWTDSMSSGIARAEATYDPATKKFSGMMEGPDMTGNVMKTRNEVVYKGTTGRVMTAWATGPDGKEMQVMKITYTRRK
jgi:hypothetical protein